MNRLTWVVALGWLGAWCLAATAFLRAADADGADAARFARPLTGIGPGEVRLEGTIDDGPTSYAPLGGNPCRAAQLRLHRVSTYRDAQDETAFDRRAVATLRVGADPFGIVVGAEHLAVPLAAWTPTSGWFGRSTSLDQLPPALGVDPLAVARAAAEARGQFRGFEAEEWVLAAGDPVFVAGMVAGDPPALGPDPIAGELVLVPGTQAAFVAARRGSAMGFRIAAAAVLAVGCAPLAVLAGLQARRRR
ncbi:MAG: hypothetical protein ABMB14_29010 [Myxococcota bacterium]